MLGNNQNINNKLFILKIRGKDEEDKPCAPYFSVTEKVGTEWKITNKVKDVQGDLVNVTTEKQTYENNDYDVIKLYLEDKNTQETYLLDLRQNMISRGIFNTILGLETYDNLSIGLYESKKGDKTYGAVSIKQNGQKTQWKYKLDELPQIQKIPIGKTGKFAIDSSELDDFYIEKLNSLGDVLVAKRGAKSEVSQAEAPAETAPKQTAKRGPKPKTPAPEVSEEVKEQDDCPFN